MEERNESRVEKGACSQLDYTQVQEDSLDESQGTTEDLNHTLQEELALRKNLDNAFADAQNAKMMISKDNASIQDRIALFERKLAENNQKNVATKPPPVPPRVTELNSSQSSKKLQVFLRIRPCEKSEESPTLEVVCPNKEAGEVKATKIRTNPTDDYSTDTSSKTSNYAGGKKETAREFEFTQVFGKESTQAEVYNAVAAPLVNRLCSGNRVGQSALLFSYGITNAGKTHTVLGEVRSRENMESWGIVPRCLMQVLQKVSNTDLKVYLSYFEIYNENIFDLLPKTSTKAAFSVQAQPLKIRERNSQTIIKGLTKNLVESLEQALDIVRKANESRHTAANRLNLHSSRSHCVCQLTVTRTIEPEAPGEEDASVDSTTLFSSRPEDSATLWIVDLAGSERSKRTNVGSLRQKEAAFINKSLMTLMGCLTREEKNYRDSKLTVLFMHHWMRSGTTSMIVNVHPSRDDYDETQHVLSYAISTKVIPTLERHQSNVISSFSDQQEYGYDGHRKIITTVDPNIKKFDQKAGPVTRIQRKRKSNLLTQRELKPAHQKPRLMAVPLAKVSQAKKQKPNEASSELVVDVADSKNQKPCGDRAAEVHKPTKEQLVEISIESTDALRSDLSEAKIRIGSLQEMIRVLEGKLETVETTVRAEVAEEMLGEMTLMTQRYESAIRELKVKSAEPNINELDRAQEKIKDLTEHIKECEEEMVRMSESYKEEQRQAAEAMVEKDAQIVHLQKLVEDRNLDISRLEESKKDLVKTYEVLLMGSVDEDDCSEDDTKSSPQRPMGHYKKRLACRTEPRVRRPLSIRTTENIITRSSPSIIKGPKTASIAEIILSTTQQNFNQENLRQPLATRSVNIATQNGDEKLTKKQIRIENVGNTVVNDASA